MSSEDGVGIADLSADLPILARAFRLRSASVCRYLTDGWMNRNWEITADRDRYVLKRILDISAAMARNIHAALSFVAERSVPVCVPLRSSAGDTVVEVDGRAYCLVSWVDGFHRTGCDLSFSAVARLGRLVGEIHQALAQLPCGYGFPPASSVVATRANDKEQTVESIKRVERAIKSLAEPIPYDLLVLSLLRRRLELLDLHGHLRPSSRAAGPAGWVHGDLNHRNLLFRGERVVAVLDWDRMRVSTYADEVVKAGQALFGSEVGVLDLNRIAVFVAAYRSVVAVERAALSDALSRLLWKRLTDVWPAEFRYLRAEPSERIAGLFPPGELALEWWISHREEVRRAFSGV
ncbi:phosphotransferase [Sphaerisporangium sp. NPDC051017]|uniref:phosphotransferase enzyme family protein n=1 Tax=Sphaerisporangium sp. NPDC051017 TaxID=3154636 RepID=UPI00341A5407